MGLGPRRWLLTTSLGAASLDALSEAFTVALDVTAAWTRIEITGPAARDLLAKGSALDLDPRRFREGACAAAPFAQIRAILLRIAGDHAFELLVGRSYALTLFEWLIEAAEEFGSEIREEPGDVTP
jgi:sarcosine oxidase subunit gamma